MKSKIVSYTLETPPPLTEAQRANLRALAARPDSEIDTSGIPEMTDEQCANAPRRYHPHRPTKRQITARVDSDVLDGLKSHGKGYQSRVNAILRARDAAGFKANYRLNPGRPSSPGLQLVLS